MSQQVKQRHPILGCHNGHCPTRVCRNTRGAAGIGAQENFKHRASRRIFDNPQKSLVGFDDRAADRQAHPHTARLCREERIEDTIDILRADSFSGVRH
jgi:hypothetical protein